MARYTKPELREQLKEEIKASDKGGKQGQWSARKSQLLTREYQKHGGGYEGPKDQRQKALQRWGDEDWQTKEGGTRARRNGETGRYLPKRHGISFPPRRSARPTPRSARSRRPAGSTSPTPSRPNARAGTPRRPPYECRSWRSPRRPSSSAALTPGSSRRHCNANAKVRLARRSSSACSRNSTGAESRSSAGANDTSDESHPSSLRQSTAHTRGLNPSTPRVNQTRGSPPLERREGAYAI